MDAGQGGWLKACKNLGSTTLIGIDGVWIDESMLCEQSIQLQSAHLGCPINNYHKFDLAISVEVAEHLLERSSDILINSITNSSDLVVFSAAYINQGGTNHFNENKHTYWAKKFFNTYYVAYDIFRSKILDDNEVDYY